MSGRMQRSGVVGLRALIVLGSILLVAACGGSTTEAPGGSTGEGTANTKNDGDVKVGLVTDQGGLNDRSFNAQANVGLERAMEELGIEGNVLESKSASDYEKNLASFAGNGFDLVIGVGFLMGDPVKSTAVQFPDTSFAIIDFSYAPDNIANVRGLIFKEQEAGYLAGALAGLAHADGKLPNLKDKNTVSSVGGQAIPPVNKYIAGYQQGVKDNCPDCRTLNSYSQDFIQPGKCKEQANAQIGQGSDIIFQVAGGCGLGALAAAQEKGVWGIGVDADQAYLGKHILTSAMKRVDNAVFETISELTEGTFAGGSDRVFGLAENGVDLGTTAAAAEPYMAQIEAIKQDIIAGKITPPEELSK